VRVLNLKKTLFFGFLEYSQAHMTRDRRTLRAIAQLSVPDPVADDRPFWIGDHFVEPRQNQITTHGQTRTVEHLAMQVLLFLAHHAGETVTREEILSAVWASTTPNDEGLTQAVCKLRKVMSDDPGKASVIQTVRKKGYRLIAPVSFDGKPSKKFSFISLAPHPDYPDRHSIRVRIHGEWLLGAALMFLTLYAVVKVA